VQAVRNLKDAAESLARQLEAGFKGSEVDQSTPRKPIVFVSRNHLVDPHTRNNYPFSSYLAAELKRALSDSDVFDVTGEAVLDSDFVLSGTYHRQEDPYLVVTCALRHLRENPSTGGFAMVDAATGRVDLHRDGWGEGWFEEDVKSRVLFLMRRLEEKAVSKIALDKKPEVMVNRFCFENSRLYNAFGEYIHDYTVGYLAGSGTFKPKKKVAETLSTGKRRAILPTPKTEGGMAALTGSDYYVAGSYWRTSRGGLEVKAELARRSTGEVLAAESVTVGPSLVDSRWLVSPQTYDESFMADYQSLQQTPEAQNLLVEIYTQKGRNNLRFGKGESIVFTLKSNREAYVRLYNRGADGAVYRIYPNDFDSGERPIPAGRAVPLPNETYASDFEFTVHEPLGNELVIVYASERPLPDLPGRDVQFYGVRRIDLRPAEMDRRFREYANRSGFRMSRDEISLHTGP
jgi:hypothetical protein